MNNTTIFHAYDVRGIYPEEVNPEAAYRIGWAYSQYLKKDLKKSLPLKVIVGMDMRGSSPFLAKELIRALNEQGIDVVEIGKVPTPAFYYAIAFRGYEGGIMVTASHNPKQYNGFKFCAERARPVGLGSGLEIMQKYFESSEEAKKVSPRGKMESLEKMTHEYVNQELSYLNPAKIKKLKIVCDPANCMGAMYLTELFSRVPCDLIKINWDLNGNMPNHEADPLKSENLRQIQALMKNEKADFGIATDGDGDRIVFLDENAEVIPPPIVVGLISQEVLKKYPSSRVGYDLRMSHLARDMIAAAGGEPIQTMVGHALIKNYMAKNDILFSGELSSHYYFRENFNFESPVFVTAMLLIIRSELAKPFSEIWKSHVRYSHSGEVNFKVENKQGIMDKLEKKYAGGKTSKLDGIKVEFDSWWFNVRPSNTEPLLRLNLEADTEEIMKQRLEEIKKEIES